jgi:hypothetical protein
VHQFLATHVTREGETTRCGVPVPAAASRYRFSTRQVVVLERPPDALAERELPRARRSSLRPVPVGTRIVSASSICMTLPCG